MELTVRVRGLVVLSIGDEFEGSIIGLEGYKLKITGRKRQDGFP